METLARVFPNDIPLPGVTPHSTTTPYVATHVSAHPTPDQTQTHREHATIDSNVQPLRPKKSFCVQIESNGNTTTGVEREISDESCFPTYFPNLTIEHSTKLTPIERYPYHDLDLTVTPAIQDAVGLTSMPKTPSGDNGTIKLRDIVVLNGKEETLWYIFNVYIPSSSTIYASYTLRDLKSGKIMIMHVPFRFSQEAHVYKRM